MRKLLVALTLGLLSAAAVHAQKKQTDREFEGLKGPVKTVSVERVVLGGPWARQAEGPRDIADSATYDAEGNLINDEVYDAVGTLLLKRVFSTGGADKVVDTYAAPKSDPPNLGGGDITRPADPPKEGPRLILRASERYKYKYDDKGNIRELTIEGEGRVKIRAVYKLTRGRKEWLYYTDGKDPYYRRVDTLDARGNVVQYEEFDTVGMEAKYSYTAYEFDARGNWVRRVRSAWTTEEGKPRFVPVHVEYQTIVYF
jgi:hypothetical protein